MAVLPPARTSKQPLVAMAVSLATGILFHHAIENRSAAIASLVTSIALLSFAILIRKRVAAIAVASLLLAFIGAGYVLAFVAHQTVSNDRIVRLFEDGVLLPNEPVEVMGQLEGEPESAPDGLYLTVRTEQIRFRAGEHTATGTVLLLSHVDDQSARKGYDALQLRHGARIRVMTVL